MWKLLCTTNLRAPGKGFMARGCSISLKAGGQVHLMGRIEMARDAELKSYGQLEVGGDCFVNRYSRIIAHEHISLGCDVTIAQFVTVLDHDHAFELQDNKLVLSGFVTSPVKIGNNVWLGEKVTVLKGATIGNNVIVGAHSLVNGVIPDNCVIGGTPAKVLRYLT